MGSTLKDQAGVLYSVTKTSDGEVIAYNTIEQFYLKPELEEQTEGNFLEVIEQ